MPNICSGEISRCGHLQGVRQAALRQLDFEPILTLGFSIPQSRFRRFAKAGRIGGLAGERRLGLGGSPRLGADAAQRHARPRHVSPGDHDHNRSRRQRELV